VSGGCIVAMGGYAGESRLLDRHMLSLAGRERPRICYLPTAGGDATESIELFHQRFADAAEASVLSLFRRDVEDLAAFLLGQHVICVGGGNTANMLAVWRVHGVDTVLREAWRRGVVLAGPSAGANCWFEACSTDSFGAGLAPLRDGLGFLSGSFCPHYDGEPLRQPSFTGWVAQGALPPGWAADDGVALVFQGTELSEVVSECDGGRAFRVDVDGETPLAVRRLGRRSG
jgi:dipeptidase E